MKVCVSKCLKDPKVVLEQRIKFKIHYLIQVITFNGGSLFCVRDIMPFCKSNAERIFLCTVMAFHRK